MRTVYVGVAGNGPGAGKDTVGQSLVDYFRAAGRNAVLAGFADPIRSIACKLKYDLSRERKEQAQMLPMESEIYVLRAFEDAFGLNIGRDLHSIMLEKVGCPLSRAYISPRTFMQLLGTEAGRSIEPDFWVKQMLARYPTDAGGVVVLTDVRFENELSSLTMSGPLRLGVFVERRQVVRTGHSSESANDYLRENLLTTVFNAYGTAAALKLFVTLGVAPNLLPRVLEAE